MTTSTRTKEFLEKLEALVREYDVTIVVEEKCYGYGGFQVEGLEFQIPYATDDGYQMDDFVTLSGSHYDADDIKALQETDDD